MKSQLHHSLSAAVSESAVNLYPFPFLSGRMPIEISQKLFMPMRQYFPVSNEFDPKAPKDGSEKFRSLIHLSDMSLEHNGPNWKDIFSDSFSEALSHILLDKFINFIPSYPSRRFFPRVFAHLTRRRGGGGRALPYLLKKKLKNQVITSDWMFTCDRPGYSLEPHTDHPRKMITFLLYVSEPENHGEKGNGTSLYSPLKANTRSWDSVRKPREQFAEVVRATHEQGHFIAFVKSDLSWHGVEASRRDDGFLRRTINLTIQRPSCFGGV
ncbi:hypothetical protein OAY00_03575 [Burkholderiales bacterium]|nr:hypothetical protein [Burkholderiales bacterium]